MNGPLLIPRQLDLPLKLGELLIAAAETIATQSGRAFRELRRRRVGTTLRPGPDTPLWNELRRQVAPHLAKRGAQARLARLLSLPRQRVHAFVTARREMPDAERTLQLLAWLAAMNRRQPPA